MAFSWFTNTDSIFFGGANPGRVNIPILSNNYCSLLTFHIVENPSGSGPHGHLPPLEFRLGHYGADLGPDPAFRRVLRTEWLSYSADSASPPYAQAMEFWVGKFLSAGSDHQGFFLPGGVPADGLATVEETSVATSADWPVVLGTSHATQDANAVLGFTDLPLTVDYDGVQVLHALEWADTFTDVFPSSGAALTGNAPLSIDMTNVHPAGERDATGVSRIWTWGGGIGFASIAAGTTVHVTSHFSVAGAAYVGHWHTEMNGITIRQGKRGGGWGRRIFGGPGF